MRQIFKIDESIINSYDGGIKMEIYIDVLILENFIVNLFLLLLTMKLIHHKSKTSIIIFSSFLGSIYTLVLVIPELKIFSYFPFQIIMAIIMVLIAYGKTTVISLIKTTTIFLLVSFTLSGICFLFSIKENIYVLGENFSITKYSIKYVILSFMILFIVLDRINYYIKEQSFVNNYIFSVECYIENRIYIFEGFLDTGNELREPITNLPCIIVEESLLSDVNFHGNNIYHIPYRTVKSNGTILGIRVNNVNIKDHGLEFRKVDAIICPCSEQFSKNSTFNALLSRGIV